MSDIDVKLKPVSYRLPRITDPLSHPFYNISFQHAADLGSHPPQLQQTIMSFMMRSPRTMEMGEKTLRTWFIVYR